MFADSSRHFAELAYEPPCDVIDTDLVFFQVDGITLCPRLHQYLYWCQLHKNRVIHDPSIPWFYNVGHLVALGEEQ